MCSHRPLVSGHLARLVSSEADQNVQCERTVVLGLYEARADTATRSEANWCTTQYPHRTLSASTPIKRAHKGFVTTIAAFRIVSSSASVCLVVVAAPIRVCVQHCHATGCTLMSTRSRLSPPER